MNSFYQNLKAFGYKLTLDNGFVDGEFEKITRNTEQIIKKVKLQSRHICFYSDSRYSFNKNTFAAH